MATYTDKRRDSYNTYIRIKGFNKILDFLKQDSDYKIKNNFFTAIVNENKDITKNEIDNYAAKYMQSYQPIDEIAVDKIEIQGFTAIYYLTSSTDSIKKYEQYCKNDKDDILIQNYIDARESYYKRFEKNFSKDDFKKIINSNNCTYCGIALKQLIKLRESNKIYSKSGRGFSLELDRIDANNEYTKENCCMSCYWCNNAKTDEFSAKDFKGIAKGINKVWKDRGADIIDFDKIQFWKEE